MTAILREPSDGDREGIAELLLQLGYPTTAEQVPARLSALRAQRDGMIVIAEEGAAVIGLATGHLFRTVSADGPVAYLTSLVVHRDARGKGVGRMLVEQVERWAGDRGAERLRVTAALHRKESHAIYQHLGFELDGLRLSRRLDGRAGQASCEGSHQWT